MARHIDKHLIARGNVALLQFLLWGALAATVIASLAFDIKRWMM